MGGAILAPVFLALLAYSQPGYFTSQTYLGGLLLLELLCAALWMYRQVFFPLILIAFLFAGTGLAVGGGWTVARWVFLGFGAAGGCVIMFKERGQRFGLFHIVALFAVLAATVSAAVSRYPDLAMLKALSLLLLFVYAATGARLAVAGRESRFFFRLIGWVRDICRSNCGFLPDGPGSHGQSQFPRSGHGGRERPNSALGNAAERKAVGSQPAFGHARGLLLPRFSQSFPSSNRCNGVLVRTDVLCFA